MLQRVNRRMAFFKTAYTAKAMGSTAEISGTFELPSTLAMETPDFLMDYKGCNDGMSRAAAVQPAVQSLKQARALLYCEKPV